MDIPFLPKWASSLNPKNLLIAGKNEKAFYVNFSQNKSCRATKLV